MTAARRPVAVRPAAASSPPAGADPVVAGKGLDPRVTRTRAHVLEHARRLLAEGGPEALTFSGLSTSAQVSRQTLYRYWASPAALAIDLVRDRAALPPHATDLPREALVAFLTALRERLDDPGVSAAYSMLLSATDRHPEAGGVIDDVLDEMRAAIGRLLGGPVDVIDRADFDLLVGPVLYAHFVARRPISDVAITRAVDHLFAGR